VQVASEGMASQDNKSNTDGAMELPYRSIFGGCVQAILACKIGVAFSKAEWLLLYFCFPVFSSFIVLMALLPCL